MAPRHKTSTPLQDKTCWFVLGRSARCVNNHSYRNNCKHIISNLRRREANMERAIYGSSAMPVTPQRRTMGRAGRYEGELDARKRARPVRWRGKALSSLDDMLIPLSFKWQRACAYCGARDIPLQVEHIHSRARGGTNQVSNLCLACEPCNLAKGSQDIRDV